MSIGFYSIKYWENELILYNTMMKCYPRAAAMCPAFQVSDKHDEQNTEAELQIPPPPFCRIHHGSPSLAWSASL